MNKIIFEFGRGICKADRVTVVLHLVHGLRPKAWEGGKYWELFLGTLSPTSIDVKTVPAWVPSDRKLLFSVLSTQSLVMSNILHSQEVKEWLSGESKMSAFLTKYQLSAVERLLVIKMLRPDELVESVTEFCCKEFDLETLHPQTLSIHQLWSEIIKAQTAPMMFITLNGHDPGEDIETLANKVLKGRR